MLGMNKVKKNQLADEFSEYNENFFSKNPLIGGLISLQNMLVDDGGKNEGI